MATSTRPEIHLTPAQWARENLFRTWYDGLITVVAGGILGFLAFSLVWWTFTGADWEIIRVNLKGYLAGSEYPSDQLWRLWLTLYLGIAVAGVLSGIVDARREEVRSRAASGRAIVSRLWPILMLIAILLWLSGSLVPLLLVAGAVPVLLATRSLGRSLPPAVGRWTTLALLTTPVVLVLVITAFGGASWTAWGGLVLTLALAAAGIVLSFPLGVLLALGRRSSLPAARYLSVVYIEFFRGVPLISLLFMGFVMLSFFLPPGFDTPSVVIRSIVIFTIFTAAYVAEIVRGGLQSVHSGQIEAAQALGMSPVRTTIFIVLPQALRNVIPALVGQFISLFKDTSLVAILGLAEILRLSQVITQQEAFRGQGLITETLIFAAVIYWVGSYTMSRESQNLEKRLGVGER